MYSITNIIYMSKKIVNPIFLIFFKKSFTNGFVYVMIITKTIIIIILKVIQ